MKKTRHMCTVMATMNISAAQWWIWRISRPPRTSKEMPRVEEYASDIVTPWSGM